MLKEQEFIAPFYISYDTKNNLKAFNMIENKNEEKL